MATIQIQRCSSTGMYKHQSIQRPDVLIAPPGVAAGEAAARVGRLLILRSPGTGVSGPWVVTGGGGPKLEALFPAAVSGLMTAPVCMPTSAISCMR